MQAKFFATLLSLSILSNAGLAADDGKLLTKPGTHSSKVNINTANLQDLSHAFKGIGQKRAESIIKYRQNHGKFATIADLSKVKGIGQVFIDKNLAQLQAVFVVE